MITGHELLDKLELNYTPKNWGSVLDRFISKWDLKEGIHFEISYEKVSPTNNAQKKVFKFNEDKISHTLDKTIFLRREKVREITALTTIEQLLNIKLVREYRVGSYRIDGYCVETNTAYEIDEPKHFLGGKLKPECVERQHWIEEQLGCKFVRIKVRGCG